MFNTILFIAIVQSILFGVFLLTHKRRYRKSNKYLAFILLSLAAGYLDHYYQSNLHPIEFPYLFLVFNFSGLLIAPLILLYTYSILDKSFFIKPSRLFLYFIPFLSVTLLVIFQYHILSFDEKIEFINEIHKNIIYLYVVPIFGFACIFGFLTYTVLYLKKTIKQRPITKVVAVLQNEKVLLVVVYICIFMFTIGLLSYVMGKLIVNEPLFYLLEKIDIIIWFSFSIVLLYQGLTRPAAFSAPNTEKKYQNSPLNSDDKTRYQIKLENYIKENSPFAEGSLTLNELAALCEVPPKYLSQIINETYGQSFFDFANTNRIIVFKQLLKNSNNQQNILNLAFDAGFTSKAAFNRAFKKLEGSTPSQYKKDNLKD